MPLAHLTDFARFIKVIDAKKFDPQKKCPVYDEYLLYTFYGRPAFRFPESQNVYRSDVFSPVCFLLKPDLIKTAVRSLPFDSGAFAKRYDPAMHPTVTLRDFESYGDASFPERIVGAFWNDNAHYFNQIEKSGLSFDASLNFLGHYYALITSKLASDVDDRSGTIEVQLPAPLNLTDNVLALIVPAAIATDYVEKAAKMLKADVVPYEFMMPFRANDYNAAVKFAARAYLADRGLL